MATSFPFVSMWTIAEAEYFCGTIDVFGARHKKQDPVGVMMIARSVNTSE